MKSAAWIATAVLLVVPTLLLAWKPDLYTPMTSFLISMIQFFLAMLIGYLSTTDAAQRSANAKWLPQAESACDRLLTVGASVASLKEQTRTACTRSARNLPELAEPRNKALRILFERQCAESANRLLDIHNHLESALADWERFIAQNCEGAECVRIGHKLLELRSRLMLELQSSDTCTGVNGQMPTRTQQPVPRPAPPPPELSLTLQRSIGRDGTYVLARDSRLEAWFGSDFVLQEEKYGWRLVDLQSKDFFLWKQKQSEMKDTVEGSYVKCPTCRGDGTATVTVHVAPMQQEPNPLLAGEVGI